MPYVFECPQCHESNYGLRTPPTAAPDGGFTFFDDLKCSRCGVTGLYWVANDRAAQSLGRRQPPVPRNRIAVGVRAPGEEFVETLEEPAEQAVEDTLK